MVVYRLAFNHDKHYHGGKNRSDQLLEWIRSQHPEAQEWDQGASPHPFVTLLCGLIYYFFYLPFRPFGLNSLRVLGRNFYSAMELLKRHPDLEAVYIEGTGFGNANIAAYFRAKRVPCFVIPCNIESLVPYDNWTHKLEIGQRFLQDIRALRAASKVYCIGYPDYWLLSLFGVSVSFLPYSPVGVVRQRCVAVAAKRKVAPRGAFLLYLANFENSPNVKAIKEFIAYLKSTEAGPVQQVSLLETPIRVVGRGLDQHTVSLFTPNMTYLGQVADEELDELLVQCEGVILYQYATTGALTRLEEYKLMEVPIYANVHATKGISEASTGVHPVLIGRESHGFRVVE